MSESASLGKVVIVGAGPAGLTAALALLERGVSPLVVEADTQVGGISKTLVYRGNRMDIGGHRFFSKNDDVMEWWLSKLPLQGSPSVDDVALGRRVPLGTEPGAPDPEVADEVMLSRSRLSRIYFLRHFFDYPVSLSASTLKNLGLGRAVRIATSYLMARIRPIHPEKSLEDFMVNRFGRELYGLFFEDYTEKVWGVPCSQIQPEWGAQRVKGVSIGAALKHALSSMTRKDDSISQKDTETSLIGRFLYPKYGPGQLWETVAKEAESRGCEIRMSSEVVGVNLEAGRVVSVTLRDAATGAEETVACDAVLSSMPARDLVLSMRGVDVPADVHRIADALPYRDFMTCGLLVPRLTVTNADGSAVLDNWIYIQERDVRVGRLQVFNNWSPYLVADRSLVWVGLEYFCNEGDAMWESDDEQFAQMAAEELDRIGIIDRNEVVDHVVHRVKKAYPAYFGTYTEFDTVRAWLDTIPNLFVMGRNGMHRYNNMDHSMLSAWAAVDALAGKGSREAIWRVNADEEYQEEKAQ